MHRGKQLGVRPDTIEDVTLVDEIRESLGSGFGVHLVPCSGALLRDELVELGLQTCAPLVAHHIGQHEKALPIECRLLVAGEQSIGRAEGCKRFDELMTASCRRCGSFRIRRRRAWASGCDRAASRLRVSR